jgi:hypothetical protein
VLNETQLAWGLIRVYEGNWQGHSKRRAHGVVQLLLGTLPLDPTPNLNSRVRPLSKQTPSWVGRGGCCCAVPERVHVAVFTCLIIHRFYQPTHTFPALGLFTVACIVHGLRLSQSIGIQRRCLKLGTTQSGSAKGQAYTLHGHIQHSMFTIRAFLTI